MLRGALNGPSPEFRQALNQMFQVAGELFNRTTVPNASTTTSSTATTAATTTADSSQSTTPNISSQSTSIGQNSQARGNTQTNPTTATHTRSTPRPHVHLAQQAMQGGFDPFLPCNSHHITTRRRESAHHHHATSQNTSNNRTESGNIPTHQHSLNIYNIINGLVNSINSVNARRNTTDSTTTTTTTPNPTTNNENNASGGINIESRFQSLLSNMPQSLSDVLRQQLNELNDDHYEQGESLFTDLIMILIRNITLV